MPNTLLATLHAAEQQLDALQQAVAETYPGDNKMAWAASCASKYLLRLRQLMDGTESDVVTRTPDTSPVLTRLGAAARPQVRARSACRWAEAITINRSVRASGTID